MRKTQKMKQAGAVFMAIMMLFYGKTAPVKAQSLEEAQEQNYQEESASAEEEALSGDGTVTLYAQWISEAEAENSGMSAYREECYFQQADGSYAMEEPELLYAKTGETVRTSASNDDYENYHINYNRSVLSGKVTLPETKDGSVKFFTLEIYYDLDEVSLSYNLNHGTGADGVDYGNEMVKYGSFAVAKESPEREGYLFAGWNDGENLYGPGDFVCIKGDVTLKAKWVKKTELTEPAKAAYLVEHYVQQADGSYFVKKSELLYGSVGNTVTAVPKEYAHYHNNKKLSETSGKVTVPSGDNGEQKLLVLKLYYDLDKVTVTYNLNKGTGSGYASQTVRYGTIISIKKVPARKGYVFTQWKSGGNKYKTGDNLKVTKNVTLTAGWTKKTQSLKLVMKAEYLVERYLQQPDGTYIVKESKLCRGVIGEKASAGAKDSDYQHYYVNKAKSTLSGKVYLPVLEKNKEKMLVLKVYYDLECSRVSYDLNGGNDNGTENKEVKVQYGGFLTLKDEPARDGYIFLGWNDGNNMYQPGASVRIKEDTVFTAEWKKETEAVTEEAEKSVCLVEYYLQQPWESGSGEENTYAVEESELSYGMIGETVTAEKKSYEYYHINQELSTLSGTMFLGDSEEKEFLVLRVYYDLDEVVLNYELNGGTGTEQVDYEPEMMKYGSVIVVKENPVKEGRLFAGWTDGECIYEPGDLVALTDGMALTGMIAEDGEETEEEEEDDSDAAGNQAAFGNSENSEEDCEIEVMLVGETEEEEEDTEEEIENEEDTAEEEEADTENADIENADTEITDTENEETEHAEEESIEEEEEEPAETEEEEAEEMTLISSFSCF